MSAEGATRGSARRARRTAGQSVFSKAQEEAEKALYHCNYCHRDISDNIRIKCAVCADFDLCVECFSVGVEINGHSNGHSYKVMDNLSFPIFHPNWGSDEELLLLEAVEIYGPGNWPAVAEHVGTKNTEECARHYYQIYIEPPSCPLPTPAPEMAGLDVRKLAELAKSSCGRKRMRLDTAAAQQQLKQLLQQDQPAAAAAAALAAAADGQQQQQQLVTEGVLVKQEQPQEGSIAAAAAADVGVSAGAGGGDAMKVEEDAAAAAAAGVPQSPSSQAGHGKVSFRQRTAEEAAAAAAAGSSPAAAGAALQQPPAHVTVGGLQIHPYASPTKQPQKQEAQKGDAAAAAADKQQQQAEQQQQQGQEGADATAAAAGGGGASARSIGHGGANAAGGAGAGGAAASAAAVAAAAAAAGGDAPRVKGSGPQLDMMTGWHAKRFEFEPEWDNDAEASIAEIEFRENDTPEEEAAKLRLLTIYNKRLDERARRQAFILENGLLHVRRMQGTDKRRLPGEREKHAQMRVFARYQPPGSHEGFVEGLLLESRLRVRIAELQAHRAAGRRTMADVEDAEVGEAMAKKKAKEKQQREAAAAAIMGAETDAAAVAAGGGASSGPQTLGGYRSTASALNMHRQRQGVQLDISGLPGADRLTAREAELCASARLLPVHYLSLKDVMMRDAQVHGHISRHDARGFFRLDSARSARIWEVLCASGWLKDNSPEEAEDKRRGGKPRKDTGLGGAAAAGGGGGLPPTQQQLQLQQQHSLQAAAVASLAVGFPQVTASGNPKPVSVAAAAAAAAAALQMRAAAAAAAAAGGGAGGASGAAAAAAGESGGDGLAASEATGATESGVLATAMDEDDDDFMP